MLNTTTNGTYSAIVLLVSLLMSYLSDYILCDRRDKHESKCTRPELVQVLVVWLLSWCCHFIPDYNHSKVKCCEIHSDLQLFYRTSLPACSLCSSNYHVLIVLNCCSSKLSLLLSLSVINRSEIKCVLFMCKVKFLKIVLPSKHNVSQVDKCPIRLVWALGRLVPRIQIIEVMSWVSFKVILRIGVVVFVVVLVLCQWNI